MKILVHFQFTPDEVEELRHVAAACGDHQVLYTADEAEAVTLASDVEVLMGQFKPAVCAAAPHLRWIQSFSAGMDNFSSPPLSSATR